MDIYAYTWLLSLYVLKILSKRTFLYSLNLSSLSQNTLPYIYKTLIFVDFWGIYDSS